ncbi:MAG: hypothetical protein ACRD4I_15170, partial [Candidatus Angelobacter sp.]
WTFYVMLGVPIFAWIVSRPFLPVSKRRNIFDAFVIALLITVSANFIICYESYLKTGLQAGMQPRYYNYALPGIFLFPLLQVDRRWIRAIATTIFSAIAVLLVAIEPPRAVAQHIAYAASRSKALITVSSQTNGSLKVQSSAGSAGYLDSVTLKGGLWILSGWAIDTQTKRPAESVVIVFKQQLLGSAQPSLGRPDVAQALNSGQALDSGYSVRVAGLSGNIDPCDFQMLAAQSTGGFTVLRNATCPQ